MRLTKLSSEKGNYSDGKAKGHLDTQLFPESEGTRFDRNIVKKEEKRTIKTKNAARIKLEQTVEQAFGSDGKAGDFDLKNWDLVYGKAKEIYLKMKSYNVPWILDDPKTKDNIKAQLIQELQVDDNTANLAATTVLHSDSRWRKQQKTNQIKTAQQNPYVHFKNPYRHLDTQDETVHVIYPDTVQPNTEQKDSRIGYKEFDIRVPSSGNQTNEDIASLAWQLLDDPEYRTVNQLEMRSPMIGDVFIVRGFPCVALGVGFAEISKSDLEKWKNIPTENKLMTFDEESLKKILTKAFSKKHLKLGQSTSVTEQDYINFEQLKRDIFKYPKQTIVEAIKGLGEEYIAGFLGVTEKDLVSIFQTLDTTQLAEILQYIKEKMVTAQCETCKIKRTSSREEIDKKTLFVGKISSLQQAKKICKEKFGRLPRIGYEMEIETGLVKVKHVIDRVGGLPQYGEYDAEYITHLQNNAGFYRVWTYISAYPVLSKD